MKKPDQKITLVTGASRGIGLGIAHELGLQGATVYVTGRNRRKEKTTDDLPGTINETAELVTKSGGKGIAIECDHTNDNDVEELAKFIEEEHGNLDILVNNVWGGYEQYNLEVWELPVWEQPIWRWDKMFQTGVRAHYTTTRAVLPLMLNSANPIIFTISFGDNDKFLRDVQYDVAKYASTRLSKALAAKLSEYNIKALTIYPGFTSTERVKNALSDEQLKQTHTPRFVGRAVVALMSDNRISEKSGQSFKVGDLGIEYGFTDVDGSQPEPFDIDSD